jgi:hypothetical protein
MRKKMLALTWWNGLELSKMFLNNIDSSLY